ncbi:glycine receptor alpha 3 subunit-like protein precursor [Saccoglossus kowalevskii]|uniref:Glycine receptor alpha 3 subunit-like protein n=1 Tax=Saccoglossus kowalevskii TaxID=10224 RepID=D1LX31_SACKO|nr:glycine receptor alpha 3 subunit-like protein precursor [Saccoglossus kowalevskii]ACY92537.1 glycine receptor alpha 3 subunit-like protein [Saccoglossus kowalevskii]
MIARKPRQGKNTYGDNSYSKRENQRLWSILLLLLTLAVHGVSTDANTEEDGDHSSHNVTSTSTFLNTLLKTYDKRIRPNFDGDPVNVTVDMLISRIDNINEVTMDYGITIVLRQTWVDTRLEYNAVKQHIPPTSELLERIWVPDMFFTNEKDSHFHDQTRDNVLLRISPSGEILYSTRLTLTVACHMQLSRFPMDEQHCKLKMESYSYTVDEPVFVWTDYRPVQHEDDLELQQFDILENETIEIVHMYHTGNFSALELHYTLHRKLGYYIISTFLPSSLLVVLSWVSFWINPEAAPARVALCITTVLTITTMAIAVRDDLPKVSYVTAVDVWMSSCLFFVFGSLVEFAFVNFVSSLRKNEKKKKTDLKINVEKTKDGNDLADAVEKCLPQAINIEKCERCGTHASRYWRKRALFVDKVARIVFPLLYFIFNIMFWPIYLREGMPSWLIND